ncbi:MAG: alpha-glucan family phosphorylase, partial [Planctomycetes bacterium]|nr:alpha-glucan family phosphorylase [Planctomycetota bacterium]
LTIGFGRRFATYKRATLLMRDPERLRRILLDAERPVQVIFAGKAHPRDNPGKELIRQIIQIARDEDLRRRIVFLEDYDICVARYLVQGVDIWLNTPRRPREASGTSGMKAALNGVINLSVLDGWWGEGYRPETGWAIGRGEDYRDEEYQDKVEASALYELLERESVPLFYKRDRVGIPRGWLAKMKGSIRALGPVFTTTRMVHEYACNYYMPAAERAAALAADGLGRALSLAAWRERVKSAWGNVRILSIDADGTPSPGVGDPVAIEASVALGPLAPDDVAVELYAGTVRPDGEIGGGRAIPMAHAGGDGKTGHLFRGEITYDASGLHGFTVRVLPRHGDLTTPFDLRCITWA